MTQVKEILLGIPLVIFVFWVFAAPLPSERIVRVCEPIHWAGNLVTSTTALASEKHTDTSVRWSDKMNYSCQYMVWRLLYQEDYNKAVAAGLIKPADGAKAPNAAAEAAKTAEAEKPPVQPQPNQTPASGAAAK
ncbi:hypothetical protein WJ96_03990 [Burkholderia ubonensis]|uniref:Uncharacterized protein n=1 Tax=Burkholderia ubonensis TaxID=101571 RepID=A0AAW3N160_9BURK|nr:hypothetical protein [Burkholderia ubonensis]KVP65536.1 hypothetical protein WJ93_23735 [Burkholderia ubonensis]KVP97736.1 hypothetical protein WJ96_03990 [Burkholderia ubonensis]KVZ92433.1 hypothetical protein WL25_15645 [Burkholderia ubonensis]